MKRLYYLLLVVAVSSCSDKDVDYHQEISRLKPRVNRISTQMASLGFPINADDIVISVKSPAEMAESFDRINDASRQENQTYVASAQNRDPNVGQFRLAYYDPNSKTLVVRASASQKLTDGYLAHELAHVYQDQKWGLAAIWQPYQEEPSHELFNITQYLIEGYAELVQQAYEQKHADDSVEKSDLTTYLGKMFKTECFFCTEKQLPENLPYSIGLRFLLHEYKKDGWASVDQVFETLPSSTEQILHPSKLHVDAPKKLTLPTWHDEKLPSEMILNGPMGEASLLEKLLSLGINSFEAFRAASGWDGDRAQIYLAPNGQKAFVWRILFDRDIDAKQLEYALNTKGMDGEVTRKGRLIDWIITDHDAMRSKIRKFLKEHPQTFEENPHDGTLTESIELNALQDSALYFYPTNIRIAIDAKQH